MATNQSITLTTKQLEALALHLEHVVCIIRELISVNHEQPARVRDVQHLELIFESTQSFVREVQQSSATTLNEANAKSIREGRPRRTRRRMP